jgi:hypothetical protein
LYLILEVISLSIFINSPHTYVAPYIRENLDELLTCWGDRIGSCSHLHLRNPLGSPALFKTI